ncbi:LysM peptidoglycan-binding domain-containing protein [Haloferula sp. A504]|uniref:LysM peptidoglycan-binding domain-containing protein n=1 Tax=Haloferula sp. A504 TaxID=3373601 RepID=UPI0031C070F9|nr:LysM peptidoglycan-binding domain-containing protein [Verrucomicrobiaceae bacterium E54]
MKWIPLLCVALATGATAATDSLAELRRQVTEQERQIRQLEVENARLRYMLTEADTHSGDPLYGTKVSGRPGGGTDSKPEVGEFYIVSEGDTLSEIAAAKGVSLEALAAVNRLSDPSTIRPGQRLQLPERTAREPRTAVVETKPEPEPEAPRRELNPHRHTVRAGENLYRISLRYGIDLEELLAANPSVDPRRLRIGQQVRIPSSEPMLAGGG